MNRALIVDDKAENRHSLRVILEGHGFQVAEARHGAEAMTLARSQPPTVIITDLLMPVMDGYILLRQWKADDQLRSVPIVVYTATYTEPQDEELALRLGADAYIIKPTEPEPFMEKLREVLAVERGGQLRPRVGEDIPIAVLSQYNEALVRQLEEKKLQLERDNRELVEDVHRRQSSELELREQKDFLDAIIRYEPECVKVISPDGILEQINPAGLAMLEASSLAEVQKRVLLDFIPRDQPVHRAAYVAFLQRVCVQGQAGSLVYPIISCRGTKRWLESHAAPLHDKRHGVALMLSITRDITERLRLEEELRRAQKMEAIGLLAGGIAHDFNNIIGIVLGNAELIDVFRICLQSRRSNWPTSFPPASERVIWSSKSWHLAVKARPNAPSFASTKSLPRR
jgi:two-component system, cell cycle sensor histidine kinase and response regulator CckA